MSVKRYFHWTCNFCPKKVQKIGHGFPKGWNYVADKMEDIKHKCDECIKKEKSGK